MKNEMQALPRSQTRHPRTEEIRAFIEAEAELLDERAFTEWSELFADEAVYWVPAARDQPSWLDHVSLYYDDKHTLKIRVQRLNHTMTHCQDPESQCVRVVSQVRVVGASDDGKTFQVRSKFIMLEDRFEKPQRVFGGTTTHTLKTHSDSFQIVLKRVDLTNCDQSFPNLTQPF
jgi:3-phenylpropionate/cinnamic acid dioxygenase small subunit